MICSAGSSADRRRWWLRRAVARWPDYAADRTRNGRAFPLRRTASGTWRKTETPVPLDSTQRTRLVLDKYDHAYAVLPFGRIAGASSASGHTD